MRDDRYSGMRLPQHLPKLFRMSERDADRRCPDRMLRQAVKVLDSLCGRELSPALRTCLRQHQVFPTLVDGFHMQSLASVSRLGSEIAGLIEDNQGLSSYEAVRLGLLSRAENYAWEQKLGHDMDKEGLPVQVSESVRRAFHGAAGAVANSLFSAKKSPRTTSMISIDDTIS